MNISERQYYLFIEWIMNLDPFDNIFREITVTNNKEVNKPNSISHISYADMRIALLNLNGKIIMNHKLDVVMNYDKKTFHTDKAFDDKFTNLNKDWVKKYHSDKANVDKDNGRIIVTCILTYIPTDEEISNEHIRFLKSIVPTILNEEDRLKLIHELSEQTN